MTISNQTPIICDTNIWYRVSDGRISVSEINSKSLLGTFINGFEFCTSPNGIKDYQQLRGAAMAMKRHADAYCVRSPLEHIKFVSEQPSDTSKWQEISQLLRMVEETEMPDQAFEEQARQAYKEYADKVKEDNQPFLDMIEEHRRQIEFKGVHKKRMAEVDVRHEHKEITKQVITNTVGGISVNWDDLELYLSTFDEWIRQLSIQPSLKMKPNDWDDLLNLVYVKPGCLYWTRDYRKTFEFISDCGCDHYLYETTN